MEKSFRIDKLARKTHIYELTGSCNSASSQAPQPSSSQLVDLPALSERDLSHEYSIGNEKHNRKGLLVVAFLSLPMHYNFVYGRY